MDSATLATPGPAPDVLPMVDVRITLLSHYAVLDGQTRRGRSWLKFGVEYEPWQRLSEGIVCDVQAACDVAVFMKADGLRVEVR